METQPAPSVPATFIGFLFLIHQINKFKVNMQYKILCLHFCLNMFYLNQNAPFA